MRSILPSWWKAASMVAVTLLLGFVLYYHSKSESGLHVASASATPREEPDESQLQLGGGTASHAQTNTPFSGATRLSSDALQDRRRMLNERRELAQRLRNQPSAELLVRLGTLWNAADPSAHRDEKSLLMVALAGSLRGEDHESNEATFRQLRALLGDASLPHSSRIDLASILGAVQTAQSVQSLLVVYQESSDPEIRELLAQEISRTGDDRWAARFHDELSPMLELSWPTAKGDDNLNRAIALALAKVGAPSGVTLLLNDAAGSANTVEELAQIADPSARAALSALQLVRNPIALTVLSTGLLNPNSSMLQQYLCGDTLAAMGSPEATRILLQWAATASDAESAWAERWFARLRDNGSFDLVATAVTSSNGTKFNSALVQSAVSLAQSQRERR